jgi:predicted S18 family serine protease
MKTEQEREQLINAINVLLHQSYDSTLDEIYALLKKIEDEEDENDLIAYHAAKSDVENNSLITWEDMKKEIANERKKDVA